MFNGSHLWQVSLIILLTAGCAGPTPYHPTLEGTGYVDQRIADNHYQVSYTANSFTRNKKVKQYLLYRAAEITLEQGEERFVVLDQNDQDVSLPGYASEAKSYRHHHFEHHHLWFGDQGVEEEISATTLKPLPRYTSTITILLYTGEQPSQEGKAYHARELIDVLGNTILRP
ncbi:MAG: hypothetical protein GY807_22000 [Gammaproteobacteria bacterium]|nr:hypothetical protein [Gammaproteobacteria bacterium]